MPVLSSVMALVASATLAFGVKVAVQVVPPSLLAKLLSTPLAALRSSKVKPVTASLKVMVTCVVSPTVSAVSATAMVAVGSTPSITSANWPASDWGLPGAGKVRRLSTPAAFCSVAPLSARAVVEA